MIGSPAHVRRSLLAPVLALMLWGCADADPAALLAQDEDGVLFLVQKSVPDAVMEALFQGRVVADQAGCIRLDSPSPDAGTVVWPFGFTLAREGGVLSVRDAAGREVGRIGGSFRFGGGHVPFLHEGTGFSAAERAQAEARCPGTFWIVGEL